MCCFIVVSFTIRTDDINSSSRAVGKFKEEEVLSPQVLGKRTEDDIFAAFVVSIV